MKNIMLWWLFWEVLGYPKKYVLKEEWLTISLKVLELFIILKFLSSAFKEDMILAQNAAWKKIKIDLSIDL